VSRAERAFVGILAAQTALCGALAAVELLGGCPGCRSGIPLAPAGFLFYLALLWQALRSGVGPFSLGGAHFAFGVHLLLAADRLRSGLPCLPCLGAAGLSAALAAAAWICDSKGGGRALLLFPGAALVAVLSTGLSRAGAESPSSAGGPDGPASVRVTVFSQPDCRWCEELRDSVLPGVLKEFGPRIQVAWRPASDLPAIRRTPTLVVARGGADRSARVIEGLPTAEALRDAIRAVEGRP
jgi:hypothetical protein